MGEVGWVNTRQAAGQAVCTLEQKGKSMEAFKLPKNRDAMEKGEMMGRFGSLQDDNNDKVIFL